MGDKVCENFVIASGSGTKTEPAVEYGITLNRYMVVWHDHRHGNSDIYGRRVQENGTLEPEKAICTAAGMQWKVEVGLNGFTYEWLVVWQDQRNWATTAGNIRAQRLEADGYPTGGEIVIAAGNLDEGYPAVVYNVN